MVLGHSVEFAPVVCSGSNSAARVGCRLLVLTRSSQGGPDCPLRHNFEGRCSPRCFGPRTAPIHCCGDQCVCRWCGDRCFAGRTGLQTSMRTATPTTIATKTLDSHSEIFRTTYCRLFSPLRRTPPPPPPLSLRPNRQTKRTTLEKSLTQNQSFFFFYRVVNLILHERKIRSPNPACNVIFRDRVIPVTSKLALQWLSCQAPGVIGSSLGLVGPVSVYCDWVGWKVCSAVSVSVWQHVQLSEQIRP